MSDELGAAAVLEAALQVALDGLERAIADNNSQEAMAYYDVLDNAYMLAEAIGYEMPNEVLRQADPDKMMGMAPRNTA